MNKTRLEALSDGIFAVVMTLTIFQFKVPAGGNLFSSQLLFMLLIYVTTFIVLASIWNSHHHVLTFLHDQKVDELILWSNHALLLMISLFPFLTVAHATYPHSLSANIGYVLNYIFMWLGISAFSQLIYKKYAPSETLRLRNRKRIKMFFFFFLPGALISIIWLYALPIITILMALSWGRHTDFE